MNIKKTALAAVTLIGLTLGLAVQAVPEIIEKGAISRTAGKIVEMHDKGLRFAFKLSFYLGGMLAVKAFVEDKPEEILSNGLAPFLTVSTYALLTLFPTLLLEDIAESNL